MLQIANGQFKLMRHFIHPVLLQRNIALRFVLYVQQDKSSRHAYIGFNLNININNVINSSSLKQLKIVYYSGNVLINRYKCSGWLSSIKSLNEKDLT